MPTHLSPPAEHVVLDVGQVLVRWDPEIPYRRHIPDDDERAWFLREVCGPDWNREQDRGRPWADGEAVLLERHPDRADQIRAYRRSWPEMVPGPVPGSVAVLDRLLAAGVDVTLLTNFAADTWAEATVLHPFLARARGATVSGEAGTVKPDPEIFALHTATFGLDPARTLFVDDSAANVEGARRAGWRAVLFTDAAGLERDLVRHGVLEGDAGS